MYGEQCNPQANPFALLWFFSLQPVFSQLQKKTSGTWSMWNRSKRPNKSLLLPQCIDYQCPDLDQRLLDRNLNTLEFSFTLELSTRIILRIFSICDPDKTGISDFIVNHRFIYRLHRNAFLLMFSSMNLKPMHSIDDSKRITGDKQVNLWNETFSTCSHIFSMTFKIKPVERFSLRAQAITLFVHWLWFAFIVNES